MLLYCFFCAEQGKGCESGKEQATNELPEEGYHKVEVLRNASAKQDKG